jgi:hypothetical protein
MSGPDLDFFLVHFYPALPGKEKKHLFLSSMGMPITAVAGLNFIDP